MNKRIIITALALTVCVGSLWCVSVQRRDLVQLRAEQQLLLAGAPPAAQEQAPQGTDDAAAPTPAAGTPSDLLKLRAEVSRLTRRQAELAGVARESEQLRLQVQNSLTNGPAGKRLPPGYIRKAQAQMVGYSTPEATLQTLLWAMKDRNRTHILQAFTPASAEKFRSLMEKQGEEFFKELETLPGWAVISRNPLPTGEVELEVEIAPGLPAEHLRLQPINGEWKIAEGL